ncbi:transcriptional regulator, padr family [hydrocarbon metagenome]|uniref:Transcriptional regulator, padr family n=1 Tax=hydrocarbon metagenome TaxID=938273 RepID=A0A0W8E9S8_9ZZZZ
MSISYAILGILSCKSLTGYDLKKIIQDSPFMYWSGNNNQIYRSLIELLDEGFVTSEVHHQESSPSKKIYTITAEGLAELKEWVFSSPEPPELKNTFLIQLAWADLLQENELNALLSAYENQVKMQIVLQKEKQRRGVFSPARTKRERYLWDMIHENIIQAYENELAWLVKLRQANCDVAREETDKMNYKVRQKNHQQYIECFSAEPPIKTEQEALDLVALCGENDTNLLMLHAHALSEDFFKLKTGIAGMILQKLVNYRVKTAIVLPGDINITGKFKELMAESNKRKEYRVFNHTAEAENWLLD